MKYIKTSIIAVILIIAVGAFYVNTVSANPSQNDNHCQTATATSTIAYMTPGTATTTLACNVQNGTVSGSLWDNAVLAVDLTASSSSKLNINFEYALTNNGINCDTSPLQCDWYPLTQFDIASTSGAGNGGIFSTSIQGQVTWTFASTSEGGAGIGASNNFATAMFVLKSPSKFVRVYFSLPVGTTNAGVWAAFVGKQQLR